MRVSIRLLVLLGCGTTAQPQLRLDGPDRVYVNHLGAVEGGPVVLLEDGSPPDGLILTLSRSGVARIEGDRVVALAPGEVGVIAEWEGAQVEWTLVVELETMLAFVSPPSKLRVGESVPLSVAATVGPDSVDAGPVSYASSDPDVVQIDAASGRAIGRGKGVAYVTARARGASAMVELEVIGP